MSKFLLDANLSPETSEYLVKTFDLDVIDLISEDKATLKDNEVVKLAKRNNRVIITFDLDFGEIYHFKEKGKLGVIVLRLENQTVESVNKVLYKFFKTQAKSVDLDNSLVILEEDKVRIDSGD